MNNNIVYLPITFLLFLIITSSCSIIPKKRCWKTGYIQKDSTSFPDPQLDFEPGKVQARIAMPEEQQHRIWVKGSPENSWVQVYDDHMEALSEAQELLPPNFTAVIHLQQGNQETIRVKFSNDYRNISKSSEEKLLSLKKIAGNNINDSIFSFLIYGCFQPFSVDEYGAPSLIHDPENPLNYEMRQLFEDVGLERKLPVLPEQRDSAINMKLLINPILAIGTGDQIYVDPAYEAAGFRKHPLSGWAHDCKDPYPLLNMQDYEQHIDRCYRNFYSFRCFENVFASMPVVSVWDDHEIRDGWGSHGDEYSEETGKMSTYLQPYFNIAKQAYIDHQVMPGMAVSSEKMLQQNLSLEQKYNYAGIPMFAFDLRSNRNIHKHITVDERQMMEFKEWCKNIKDSSEVIIISSMPFFYKPFVSWKLLGRIFKPGLRDDINDGWYSKYNEDQRNVIMQEIINLRNRNIKPIILSGDAHLGGMISSWYKAPDGEKRRLCYEFIFSGLSHEALGEKRNGFVIAVRERAKGNRKNDPTFPVGKYEVEYIYEYIQGRLNFGALQFDKNEKTIASLFIVGNDEKHLKEVEMPLNWNESYEEYLERAIKVDKSTYSPPVLSEHRIMRKSVR